MFQEAYVDKMVLVIDESGAKGYAKTKEQYEGEIGVMAGFLYTEADINQIELMFDSIINRYSSSVEGKFHITDLDEISQGKLREEVFFAFKRTKLQWFYKGIYAEGFHQSEFDEKRGGFENRKELLHSQLFKAMFIQSLSMAESINKNDLHLIIKTDNIDESILKKFKIEAELVCDMLLEKEKEIFKNVRDEDTGVVVKNKAVISTKTSGLPKFKDIKFDIICESSSLTIVADILANSVNYYLRENQKQEVGVFINNKVAIAGHPLAELAFIPKSVDHVLPLLDIKYRRNET